MDDYELEEAIITKYAFIYENGAKNVTPEYLEEYRMLVLEQEYRDQQKPKATVTRIK